jgi:hypothetical protein
MQPFRNTITARFIASNGNEYGIDFHSNARNEIEVALAARDALIKVFGDIGVTYENVKTQVTANAVTLRMPEGESVWA